MGAASMMALGLMASGAWSVTTRPVRPTPAADTIYLHGQLATMDAAHPRAQALAVKGDRIVAVGSDAAIERLAGPGTRRVDLRGHFLMPGFNDAHTHVLDAGSQKLQLDLTNCRSLVAFKRCVRDYAARLPAGAWILGGHWDQTQWPGKAWPTRRDLDSVTGDHPAFLSRMDGHAAVANSLALKLAGVTRATQAPFGGRLGRFADAEPNGVLFDVAQGLVARHIPPPSDAELQRALEAAMRDALAHGVTSIQDLSDWQAFLVFERMERAGNLHFRVYEWLPFDQPVTQLVAERAHHDLHDPWLHTGMLKGFMDGSLGSRTAAMLAPYADDPGNRGLPRYQEHRLDAMAVERARAGFQLGFHAIGDRAARMALDAFEASETAVPNIRNPQAAGLADPLMTGARNRIEHLQVLAPSDIPRLKRLNVIASVQPSHLLDDGRWANARLGPERARYSYLWKRLLDEGVMVAFGTDYPVEPIDPMLGLYAAVTRAAADGSWTYYPSEKISMAQALYAYTRGSAAAEFAEDQKGSLTAGKLADFVVLSQDLLAIPAPAILKTHVEVTVVGGRAVYTAPDWAAAGPG